MPGECVEESLGRIQRDVSQWKIGSAEGDLFQLHRVKRLSDV